MADEALARGQHDGGARALEQLKIDGIAGLRRGEVLAITISVVGTMRPEAASWFKVSRVEAMGKTLFGRKLFAHPQFEPTDLDEYLQLLRALFALFGEESGWDPLDLFDVQGFVWVALYAEPSWLSSMKISSTEMVETS